MKILFVGKKSSSAGGPSTVMTMLKNYLEKSFNDDVNIINSDTLSLKKIFLSNKGSSKFEKEILDADIINFHEFWDIDVVFLTRLASALGTPFFFTFHGVLNKWSLRQNAVTKKIFLKYFGLHMFKMSAGFQFLTLQEYSEAKNIYNFSNKSFILQNGIKIKELKDVKKKEKNDVLKILYLGRFHSKKGLEVIIDSINFFKEKKKNIFFRLVGPDSKYGETLKKRIKEEKIEKYISIEEPVYELEKKIELFVNSDFFILPSYDEADSMALKESLAYGLPVIITKECKFFDVEKNKIGFFIDHDPINIYEKISNINCDENELIEMSKRCVNFATKIYNINNVGNFYRENLKEIISGVQYSPNWNINKN